ncbi:MAG: hypothetical protein R3E01_26915 [Pirellulaceae bacterium]|nr:hypothetical protein [Planctomycetales bacterium]
MVWFLVTWGSLVVLVSAALLGFYLYNRVDEEIRAHVERLLSEQYPDLHIAVRSARLVEREGFEILGVSVSDPTMEAARGQLAYCEKMIVRCRPRVEDLVQGRLEVRTITLRDVAIRATCSEEGRWSIERLLEIPAPVGAKRPTIHIENGVIEIVDPRTVPLRLFTLRDINLHLTPQEDAGADAGASAKPVGGAGSYTLEGSFAADQLKRCEIAAVFELASSRWAANLHLSGLELSPALYQLLPRGIVSDSTMSLLVNLQARSAVDLSLRQTESGGEIEYRLAGKLSGGRWTDPRLPLPVTDLAADFELDNGSARVHSCQAAYAGASLRMQASSHDPASLVAWRCEGFIDSLNVDERMAELLPPSMLAQWEKFRPVGLADIAFNVSHDGRRWRPELELQCRGIALRWEKFPYPVTGLRGGLQYRDDSVKFDLVSEDEGPAVQVWGEIQHPGEEWRGWARAKSLGPMPISRELLDANRPTARRIVGAFGPQGWITFMASAERPADGDGEVAKEIQIRLVKCSIRHESFRYPLQQISGQLKMKNDVWQFYDLEGRNDSAYVKCSGSWDARRANAALELEFIATDVPLEDELRDALSPAAQETWRDLQPRGTLDHMRVVVRQRAGGGKPDVELTAQKWVRSEHAEARSITLFPKPFPYRMDDVTGTFTYRNGQVWFRGVRAHHGPTTVAVDGESRVAEDGQWMLRFDRAMVDRLQLNDDLVSALPRGLKRVATDLRRTALMSVDGSVEFSGRHGAATPLNARWHVLVDLDGGHYRNGIELNEIVGGVRLEGESEGEQFRCRGELGVDSLMYRGVQLTQIEGPLWIDNQRMLMGAWAQSADGERPPRRAMARLFGGQVEADLQVLPASHGQFDLQASYTGCALNRIITELSTQPSRSEVKGSVSGVVQLSGTQLGTNTWRGGGAVRLREADMGELPAVLALLRTLRTGSQDRAAFDSSDVVFRIQGDHLYFDRFDLRGDSLTLKGVGELSLDRDVKLDFYTVMGNDDNYLPFVKPLLGEASRRFLQIRVMGKLDNLQMEREVLPGLNESLQQFFPEESIRSGPPQRPPALGALRRWRQLTR